MLVRNEYIRVDILDSLDIIFNEYLGGTVGQNQRIFMDKELTAAPFVVTTSLFCCRKPEAIRKTTPEPLLAEW